MVDFGSVSCPMCGATLDVSGNITGVHDAGGEPYIALHVTRVVGCPHVDPPRGPAEDETVPAEPSVSLVALLGDWFGKAA